MTKRSFQSLMSRLIIVYHLGICALVVLFWMINPKGPDANLALSATLSILIPFTAAYVAIAVSYAEENMDATEDATGKLSSDFIFAASVLPAGFAITIFGIILAHQQGLIESDAGFTAALGMAETGVGVYAGRLIKSLYGISNTATKAPANTPQPKAAATNDDAPPSK